MKADGINFYPARTKNCEKKDRWTKKRLESQVKRKSKEHRIPDRGLTINRQFSQKKSTLFYEGKAEKNPQGGVQHPGGKRKSMASGHSYERAT